MSQTAEEKLKGMLNVAGLPAKSSYTCPEVCAILGISDRTFWRLVSQYEKDGEGRLKRPDCLDSYLLSRTSRVTFDELAAYLARNNTYERRHAVDPNQMELGL